MTCRTFHREILQPQSNYRIQPLGKIFNSLFSFIPLLSFFRSTKTSVIEVNLLEDFLFVCVFKLLQQFKSFYSAVTKRRKI